MVILCVRPVTTNPRLCNRVTDILIYSWRVDRGDLKEVLANLIALCDSTLGVVMTPTSKHCYVQ